MRKLLVCAMVFALIAGAAHAGCGKVWDDLSWWGNTGATPEPVKDSARSGYWWHPKVAASNVNDAELWGNRGLVYSTAYEPMPERKEVTPPPPPPPVEPKPAKVERSIPVFNNVLFAFDKAVLSAEGKAETDKVIAEMGKHPKDTLSIEGHTCNIGPAEYNMDLGKRRANAVKHYMVQSGVPTDRITTVSYGEEQPAVSNDTPANRRLNRRAVFKLHIKE